VKQLRRGSRYHLFDFIGYVLYMSSRPNMFSCHVLLIRTY
jgi:hypothetical protein